MNLKELLFLKAAGGGGQYVEETGYEHENVSKLTFLGNPYAFSPLTVYTKPNVIPLPAFDSTYDGVHIVTHDGIITYNGTAGKANDIAFVTDNVDIAAGTYYGFVMPFTGESTLGAAKNMYVDFWYDGNTGDRDVRVKIEDVKDTQKSFTVTLASHVSKIRVYAGYAANTYNDYRLYWYMCQGEISSQQVSNPIADGAKAEITLANELPYVYTGQHKTTVKKPV